MKSSRTTPHRRRWRFTTALFALGLALFCVTPASHAQQKEPAAKDCPDESGVAGNWSWSGHSGGWSLTPQDFELLPRVEFQLDPYVGDYFKQSVNFKFSEETGIMAPPSGGPMLMLFVEAYVDPPPGLALWVMIDEAWIPEQPVPAVSPHDGVAGLFLEAGATKRLMKRMEKGNQAEFWFAEKDDGILGIAVGLNGFTAASDRAHAVNAKSAATAKNGECDPYNWLRKKN